MKSFQESIRSRFSRAALKYDRAASIQRDVAGVLADRIPGHPVPETILDAGCGSGQLTRLLADKFPQARLEALDISPSMLKEAGHALLHPTVRWMCGDITGLDEEQKYDLIASSSSLHWITPPQSAITTLQRALRNDGLLAAAIMTEGTLQELHDCRAEAAPEVLPREKMLPASAWIHYAEASGLSILSAEEQTITHRCGSVRELLTILREQGVTGGHLSRGTRLLNRTEVNRVIDLYHRRHATSEGIPATFHVLFLMARKRSGPAASDT